MEMNSFTGFSKEAITFYRGLTKNNDTGWFQEHKEQYQRFVLEPSKAFILAMGERLSEISPNIIFDTRTNGGGSLFRIYRDVRFSKDKRPYKTYLGIYFWEGSGKKLENPGFYFHLAPAQSSFMLGAGMYVFPRQSLELFRQSVIDDKMGPPLTEAVRKVTASGVYQIGGQHYKRIPRGYVDDHPNAEYLLHNGLWASFEGGLPEELYSFRLLDYCMEKFREMDPIQRWLVQMQTSYKKGVK